MALLEVRGLEKWYGRRQVVNGVDFDVNSGEVVGLLGPNGAGKTTSFRMTIGLITADGGSVVFEGRDVTKMPMYLRARAGMGYLAQDSSVFKQLSVEDNLMAILETVPGMKRRQRVERQDELLALFGLTKIRRTKANRVSGGERRRLEIARALITNPKMIMLDEPFAGIDPITVGEIQEQIRDLVRTFNIGILLTDHQFRETLEVSDRIYVIREGRVFAYGNAEQIINNEEVRKHYIGQKTDMGGNLFDGPHLNALLGPKRTKAEIADETTDLTDSRDEQGGYTGAIENASKSGGTGLAVEAEPKLEKPKPKTTPSAPMAVTVPAPSPNTAETASDLERILGGTVTVSSDYMYEEVEVEGTDPNALPGISVNYHEDED